MPNLTKNNLVKKISEKTGLTQQEVFSVVQLTLEGITEGLATGNNVELRNFGVFEVRLTKKRIGRNPKKPQETVEIPPRAIVKFTSGKIMKLLHDLFFTDYGLMSFIGFMFMLGMGIFFLRLFLSGSQIRP